MSSEGKLARPHCSRCGFPRRGSLGNDDQCIVCGAPPSSGTALPTLRLIGPDRVLDTSWAVGISLVLIAGAVFLLSRGSATSPVASQPSRSATPALATQLRTPTIAPRAAAAPTVQPRPTSVATVSPTQIPQPTLTQTATPTPQPEVVQVGNTEGEGVYLRRTASLADRLNAYAEGTPLRIIGPDVDGDGLRWRHVATPDGGEGYVPAEYTAPLGSRVVSRPTPTPPPDISTAVPAERVTSRVIVGATGRLVSGRGERVVVAVDRDSYDQVTRAAVIGDQEGLLELALRGKVFFVPPNTRVRVIDLGGFLYSRARVRILEGQQAGRSGWVAYEEVVP